MKIVIEGEVGLSKFKMVDSIWQLKIRRKLRFD